jgi:diacylglycerol kinase (ATP)
MKQTGWARVVRATRVSLAGLRAALTEPAFRAELAGCLVGVPLALWLGKTGLERAILIASLLAVLITELLNTAVETVVDRIGVEHHPLSGRAKDIGSAAVFVALVQVPVVWGLVLLS